MTRLTNERHRFEIVRDDGTSEAHDLETRSTLVHDLTHYAVESEAGLRQSFFGLLAQGISYEALILTPPATPEPMQTEAVVAQLQGTFKHGDSPASDAELCAQRIASAFSSFGAEPPEWLTSDFVARARERLRRVQGQWRATPFHDTLQLEFPLPRR